MIIQFLLIFVFTIRIFIFGITVEATFVGAHLAVVEPSGRVWLTHRFRLLISIRITRRVVTAIRTLLTAAIVKYFLSN